MTIFHKKSWGKRSKETNSSFFLKKALYEVKSIIVNWSRDILNFQFLEKGLGIVSPPYFVYDFSRKIYLMLYSISWSNSIASLLSTWDMGNVCIAIICFPGCDVISFEIDHVFLIKPFFFHSQKVKTKI